MPILSSGWVDDKSGRSGLPSTSQVSRPRPPRRDWRVLLDRIHSRADRWTVQHEQDWLEAQMENIYYHKRPAIQEHNVSANKDRLTIGRRRRQLPFKIDGNRINSSP